MKYTEKAKQRQKLETKQYESRNRHGGEAKRFTKRCSIQPLFKNVETN